MAEVRSLNNMDKLEIINIRLELFKKYLEYRTDRWYQTPLGRLYMFKTQGVLYHGNDTLSFNEWLEFYRLNEYIF